MANTNPPAPVTGLEIAVIGMAGRFPGAQNIEEYWENLKNGKETTAFFNEEELLKAGVSRQLLENPNYVKAHAMLEDTDCFDAAFFDYTPVEAGIMDPQMRLFHQCVWHALEDAGYDPETYNGAIGLYAGASTSFDWKAMVLLSGKANELGQFALNQLVEKDYLSLRITYKFNLKGPAITMYTACSTSLVSIHMACQGILNGECSMALAGGVTVSQLEKNGYLFQEGSVGSRDGHTRAFDTRSAGTISGSGAGVVVLRRLEDAAADRDYIYAVIKGTAINNDGIRKVGFTAPSVEGQAEVMRIARMMAEVNPESIQYVEAHGTATELGDPVEIEALKLAYNTNKKHFCAVGSVKTNFGHLDSASGVAGFIKTVLALDRKMIPPSLHFESPNPGIDFENSPFYVNNRLQEWKRGDLPRRAAVNSLGIGGTNAHVILEEFSQVSEGTGGLAPLSNREYQLILLSAKTPSALERMTRNLVDFFKKNPHISLADAAYTLQLGRRAFAHRCITVCSTNQEAIEALSKTDSPKRLIDRMKEENPPVVFMFSGQGSQYVNMGLDLYQQEPLFRREMDRCFHILESITGTNLKSFLYPEEPGEKAKEKINHVLYSGPVKFTFEYSMARLLMEWGIEPYALVGHSFGEYAAACLAGVFSLEGALKLVVLRGRLMEKTAPGAMMSVALPAKELTPLLGDTLFLAAVNTENLCIISGAAAAVEDFESQMEKKGVETIRINFPRASHSPLMRPILPEFEAGFRSVQLNKPKIPYISGLTGDWITVRQATNPSEWCRHMMETVRFSDGIATLLKNGNPILVQVSSDRGLPLFAGQHPGITPGTLILNLTRHPKEQIADSQYLLLQIGRMWLKGVPIQWEKFHSSSNEKRFRVPLPGCPFERQRFPVPADPFKQGEEIFAGRSLVIKKPDMADWFYIPTWTRTRPPVKLPFRESAGPGVNWLVFDNKGSLAARLVQYLVEQGHQVSRVTAGKKFTGENSNAYVVNPGMQSDYIQLVRELKENRQTPRRIVHLWSLDTGPAQESGRMIEEVDRVLESGFYTLFYLVRALGEEAVTGPLGIEVITDGMQDVTGGELSHPLQAAVLGPVKVIPWEYPAVTCRSIDILLPETGSDNEELLVRQLSAELLAAPPEPVVAYRGGSRWEPGVKPVRLEKSTPGNLPFKTRGVYLITGGLGGIGLVLALHLAASVQAKLVLTSRSDFPPGEQWNQWLENHDENDNISQKIKALHQVEAQGGEVLVVRADAANLNQMQAAVQYSVERFGDINGVVHCAGVPDGAAVAHRTREMTDTILAPKIKGTLVLDYIFKDKAPPLDFLVLCSSINAIIPAFGQLGHCGANAFMDAFALYRTLTGIHSFTVSINWNSWLEKGQAAETARKSGHANSLLSMEGVEVLERVLGDSLPRVIVSTIDFPALLERFHRQESGEAGESPDLETVSPAPVRMQRPELDTEYVPPRDGLEQALVEIWQKNFGFEKIGIHDNFFQLGGDSLKGMMFVNQYKKLLQEIVHVTVVFSAPTIAELKEYFLTHYPRAAARLKGQDPGADTKEEEPKEQVNARQIARVSRLLAYPLSAESVKAGEEKNLPAVFILSPARSGSTLLRVILAGHPGLFAPPELALLSFNTLAESKPARQGVLRALMQIKNCSLGEAEQRLQELEQQGLTIKEFYRQVQQWLGDRLLVDKTPGYALDINVLNRAEDYFNNPFYIHLVRHPMAMIHSFEEAKLDLFFGSHVLEELSLSRRELAELDWTISHRNILEFFSQVPGHRRCRVMFEELLRNPEPVVNNLCRSLGIEFHPDMLNPYKETKQRMTDGIHNEGLMIGDVKFHQHKGINPGVADAWEQHYRENFLGDITIELAKSFGYQLPDRDSKNPANRDRYASVQPTEMREYYPLSPSQKQLYVLQQLDPRHTGYNMTRVLSLTGASIDKEQLEHTFKQLIARHESLRTSFHMIDEQPVQRIHDEVDFEIEYYDLQVTGEGDRCRWENEGTGGLAPLSEESHPSSVVRHLSSEFIRPFDLSRTPLLRVGLVQLEGDTDLLLIDIHHIISDAASHGLIARDFAWFSQGRELSHLKLQYRDYVLWLRQPGRQAAIKQQEAWWLKVFAGELPILNLPADYPRPPVRSFEGDTKDFQVGKEITMALRALAAEKEVTLNMLMPGIFHILLSRLSGQEDIITGTSIKNRGHADLEDIIGIFINTLALRTCPSAEKNFWEYLEEVKEFAVKAYDNQDYPFEDLVKKVWTHRDPERNPLFDVMFEIRTMGTNPGTINQAGKVSAAPLRYESKNTKFDLDWMGFEHEEGIFFTVTFCTRLFKKETIEFMCNCWRMLLEEVIKNSNNQHLKIKELKHDMFARELSQDDDIQFDF